MRDEYAALETAEYKGELRGLIKGKIEGKIETAKIMKAKEFDIALISKLTGLSKSELAEHEIQ